MKIALTDLLVPTYNSSNVDNDNQDRLYFNFENKRLPAKEIGIVVQIKGIQSLMYLLEANKIPYHIFKFVDDSDANNYLEFTITPSADINGDNSKITESFKASGSNPTTVVTLSRDIQKIDKPNHVYAVTYGIIYNNTTYNSIAYFTDNNTTTQVSNEIITRFDEIDKLYFGSNSDDDNYFTTITKMRILRGPFTEDMISQLHNEWN